MREGSIFMKIRFFRSSALGAAAVLCFGLGAAGQGSVMDASAAAKHPDAANKPTPRAADGHPDLNGVWHHYFMQGGYTALKPGQSAAFSFGIAGPGVKELTAQHTMPVYRPEFAAKVKEADEQQERIDPTLHCMAPGIPRLGPPNQIVQTRGQVVCLYTDLNGEFFRVVPTDGRKHRTDAEESYNGDAIGRWDGDTLVVDTNNFVDDTWMEENGLLHSNKMHVTERLTRKGDTIRYEVTVDDPVMLAKPWVMDPRTLTMQDDVLDEAAPCVEKDALHLTDLSHHTNSR
jgi:hypothetical protein